jgi:hypothetical protein
MEAQESSGTRSCHIYYFAFSLLHVCSLVREKMLWWLALAKKKMWRCIASFGDSYHGDVLQFAKQFFCQASINDQILCHERV